MSLLYLVSPYYDREKVSGANKRFDAIGSRLVEKLGSRCIIVVPEGQKPRWIEQRNCRHVAPFSSPTGRVKAYVQLQRLLAQLSSGTVITDFIPIPFWGLRKHRHFQLLHDLRDFTVYSRRRLAAASTRFLRWQLRRCEHVITVSETARSEIVETIGLGPDKVVRSYNGIDEQYRDVRSAERDIDLLYVATFERRKNHEALMNAASLVSVPLKMVFVGRDHGLRGLIEEYADRLHDGAHRTFEFIDHIDEKALVDLYRRTKTYVCPSLLEGFGMPLVEALATNCRVVCSDLPVFREICREHADYFDPHDPGSIALCIENSLRRPATLTSQEYARRFAWQTITADLLRDLGIS